MMGGYGWGWFMPIVVIIFWGLVIWGVVALVRYIISSGNKHTSSALDTLKMRYAQGEVSKAEYEEKKKALI